MYRVVDRPLGRGGNLIPAPASIGIFTTLTGAGSRALVERVLAACHDGTLPGVRTAFVLVNRAAGESNVTDASVAALEAAFAVPFVRVSATAFERAARRAARARAEAGDEAPLQAWRDAWWASFGHRLPPTDVDLCLGDMWIWGPRECAERRGLNLHPALPTGPLGKMWFDVTWDLVAADARESGVMIHRIISAVDEGPVAAWCRYPLRGGDLDALWSAIPPAGPARDAWVAERRGMGRDSDHPLFLALRRAGMAREVPLLLATVRAIADGRLRIEAGAGGGVLGAGSEALPGGLDLTSEVEAAVVM